MGDLLPLARLVGAAPAAIRLLRTCPDCGKPHGKPRVAEPAASDVELSVTHTAELVGVALTRHVPGGLDAEGLGALEVEELARTALAEAEALAVAAVEPQERRARSSSSGPGRRR